MPKMKNYTGGALASRNSIKIFVILSTFVLMLSLVQIASSQNLPCHVNNRNRNIENEIYYDEYIPWDNYTSTTAFNSAAMDGIYSITNSMINSLIPDILPIDLLETSDGVHIKDDDYLGVVRHYMSYIIFISVFLLFAILMPIIGLCLCCCRCCGNCGAEVKTFDKKQDHWKKVILGSMLLALVILFLFGMVGAFGTNEQLQEGTDNLVPNLNSSIEDASWYFRDISNHVKHLMDKNLRKFSHTLIDTVGNTSDMVYEKLADMTEIDLVYDAFHLAEKIEPVKENLTKLNKKTSKLRGQALQINDATRAIKMELVNDVKDCHDIEECQIIIENAKLMVTNIDLNQIPDLENVIKKIDDIDDDFVKTITEGKKELDNVQTTMKIAIEDNVKNAQTKIDETAKDVITESEKFLDLIKDMNSNITEISTDGADAAKRFIEEYGIYRYYLGLTVSCIFLLIALCIFIGLTLGICTNRPDPNRSTCCNKAIGNGFLIFGVGVMFLTSTILVIILIAHNMAMILHLLVCDPIRNPSDSSVIEFIDEVGKLEEFMWPNITLKSVITNCYENKSAYEVFNIKEKFDIDDIRKYIEDLNITQIITKISAELESTGIIEDLQQNLKVDDSIQELKKLKGTGLGDIDFNQFNVTIDENVFENISKQLDKIINIIESVGNKDLATKLKSINFRIDAYIKNLLTPMKENAKDIMETARSIVEEFNSENGFDGVIEELIKDLEEMKEAVKNINYDQLTEIVEPVACSLLEMSDVFVNYTIANVKNELGKCAPLALSVNVALIATCDNILQPMNGFWFSIFWCLVFFVPMIIVSIKLGSLFKKIELFSPEFIQPYGQDFYYY